MSDDVQQKTALLLTSPGCVHCAALKRILQKLLDEGQLDDLQVVDVTASPDMAGHYGVKSVPWLKLGPFLFQGAQREIELRGWIKRLGTPEGLTSYIEHLLQEGDLNRLLDITREKPEYLQSMLPLIDNPETDLKVRLGISAVFEELENSAMLENTVVPLGRLAENNNARVRADAAHFLSLTHSKAALPILEKLTRDSDREVREIATDALTGGG